MAQKKIRFQPYQLNKIAQFGVTESHENAAGVNVSVFVPKMKLHYARVKHSITQRYLAEGTDLSDTIDIAVRHNASVEDMQQVMIDNVAYNIQEVSPDDMMYIAYDFVTIRKVKRGGGRGGA